MIGMHRGCRSAMPLFCDFYLSAGKVTLIATDNKDCRHENSWEKVVCRQKQRQKDSDADPEHDKANCFFHGWPSDPLLISLFQYMQIMLK